MPFLPLGDPCDVFWVTKVSSPSSDRIDGLIVIIIVIVIERSTRRRNEKVRAVWLRLRGGAHQMI
jgi:hypothetical protein